MPGAIRRPNARPPLLRGRACPQIKEFERFSTTVANAAVGPVIEVYLHRLAERLTEAGFGGDLFVMLSRGGVASVAEAMRLAAGTVLSGPAGGVAAAVALSEAGLGRDLIAFDMGGTSTDIALMEDGRTASDGWTRSGECAHRVAGPRYHHARCRRRVDRPSRSLRPPSGRAKERRRLSRPRLFRP
jgi:hypothetical protein